MPTTAANKRGTPLSGSSFNLRRRDRWEIERKLLCHMVEQICNLSQGWQGAAFFHQQRQIAFSFFCIWAVAVATEIRSTEQNSLNMVNLLVVILQVSSRSAT